MPNTSSKKTDPKIGKTIWEDINRGDIKKTLRRDFYDLKEFFLDDERRERLSNMNWFKRWFLMMWWLLKSLFFNLTPVRRLLFIIAFILMLLSQQIITVTNSQYQTDTNFSLLAGLIILFILMLELKDKLLAKSELSEGRSIQFALMPDESPKIPGWDVWLFTRPANDVGGDLVDYLPLNSSQYGLMLADVSGKGLGAALFMAKLQATIRALAPDYDSLDKLGKKLNLIFHRDSISNRFASLLYIQLSPDSTNIRFMNAGHFPPMIIKDQKVSELMKGDPALGLSPKSNYKEKEIEFNDVDLLLVYSDGLTEAQDETGEFFGDLRLKNLLKNYKNETAIQMGKQILLEVDRFIGEANPTDDFSMIVLKRNT